MKGDDLLTEREKYELSLFSTLDIIKTTDDCIVEVVQNSLDRRKYIKKTYFSDKREIYFKLANMELQNMPMVHYVFFESETIIIEDYIEGHLLSDEIKKKSRLDSGKIIKGLLRAVNILHQNNIIHRDIKPENIVIDRYGEPYLIDFGISREFRRNRSCDTENLGTQGYAAPEQFGFSQSDFRSDIYAIGMTIDELAKSCHVNLLYQIVGRRCREFDPNKRYQSINSIFHYMFALKIIMISVPLIFFCAGIISAFMIISSDTANKRDVTYDAFSETSMIVDSEIVSPDLECISVIEDSELKNISLGNEISCDIDINKIENGLKLIIDSAYEFEVQYSDVSEIKDYENTEIISEIILYDMDNDGIDEIIPTLCDGRIESDKVGIYLLRNGTNAWCIFRNHKGEYQTAKEKMVAEYEPIRIYRASPGLLWTDFPCYYELKNEEIIRREILDK